MDKLQLKQENLIGSGNFSQVYKYVLKKNGRNVAIRLCDRQYDESCLPNHLEHPNIMYILDKFEAKVRMGNFKKSKVYTVEVYPLMDRNLEGLILNLNSIFTIFEQVISGVKFLHSNSIAHCDLNPKNILVTNIEYPIEYWLVKVGDFNCSILNAKQYELEYDCTCLLTMLKDYLNEEMKSINILTERFSKIYFSDDLNIKKVEDFLNELKLQLISQES